MNLWHHHVHFHFQAKSIGSSTSNFWNPFMVPVKNQIEMRMSDPVPARDRVIDFGKYKGKMLGALPSGYLKWVSKNLRAGDMEGWAKLSDQVLQDPIYRDRIEWEFAENVLNGNRLNFKSLSCSRPNAVSELMEISERFGWDNQDKVGWAKLDFQLLGTSKGGRIPRPETQAKPKQILPASVSDQQGASASARTRRIARRERQKMVRLKREEEEEDHDDNNRKNQMNVEEDDEMLQNGIAKQFPGRQALLRKAINHRRRLLS